MSAKSDWDRLIGPMFDRAGLLSWRRMTGDGLDRLVAEGRVIQLIAADDHTELYPAFQFDLGSGRLMPHLVEIWPILSSAYSPWTAAFWLHAPDSEDDGRSAAEILLADEDQEAVARVLVEAKHDAARMTAP